MLPMEFHDPVLILDFDGVLHHAQGRNIPEFARLPLLEEALSDSDCNVVISSTWREHYTLPELRRMLGKKIGPRVIDSLGPDARGPYLRHQNILAWLGKNSWYTNWRALDDSASEFPPGCLELILCDGRIGLTAAQVQIIKDWLRG